MAAGLAHIRGPAESATSYLAKLAQLGASRSPAGWDSRLLASQVTSELRAYLRGAAIPAQGKTSLCGPAAFFYCLLRDRPDLFTKAAHDLWTTGSAQIGQLVLSPSKPVLTNWQSKTPRFVDWMLLGSLRASGGGFPLQGAYRAPEQQFQAISMPDRMSAWFGTSGMTALRTQFVGPAKRLMVAAFPPDPVKLLGRPDFAGDLVDLHAARSLGWHVLLIDDNLLSVARPSRRGFNVTIPKHWVVLNPKVPIWVSENRASKDRAAVRIPIEKLARGQDKIGDTPLGDAELSLQVVTWGNETNPLPPGTTVSRFFCCFFGLTAAHLR